MSQVQVTLSFASVEDAVVGLGKLAGLPAAVAVAVAPAQPDKIRQGRSDAGKTRGPHKNTTAADASLPQGVSGKATTQSAVTDPGNVGQQATTPTSTPAQAFKAAPTEPAATIAAVVPPQPAAPTSMVTPGATSAATQAPAAAVPPVADVQKAVERMFNAKGYEDCALLLSRFGVKRWSDLPADQRANFIRRADGVIAGEAI